MNPFSSLFLAVAILAFACAIATHRDDQVFFVQPSAQAVAHAEASAPRRPDARLPG